MQLCPVVDSVLSVVNELLGATLSKLGPCPASVILSLVCLPLLLNRCPWREVGKRGHFLFRLPTLLWGDLWRRPRVET